MGREILKLPYKSFKKKKDFLVCVDSDGCAMDTMDIKHFRCFGPCMIDEWGLHENADEILARWNEINLYSKTRGINRFKGLSRALAEINEKQGGIEGMAALAEWVKTSPELSNDALVRKIAEEPCEVIFKKALNWSRATNEAITKLPEEEIKPFPLAREALMLAHELADVAIVSSANQAAVVEEWTKHGLIEHTDVLLSQNAGSKAYCIGELLKHGYAPDRVLMCGDAPGDFDAASKNGVFYFPILVKRERESWEEFMKTGLKRLIDGSYGGEYQKKKIAEFNENLKD